MILAIANKKGGVSKTTTAIAFSSILAQKGKRVLLIDIDPQGNASTASGSSVEYMGVYELLAGEELHDITQHAEAGYDFVSADSTLNQNVDKLPNIGKELLLSRALENHVDDYDYIIIDTPPSMGFFTVSALIAADSVLIPCRANRFTAEGISELWENIQTVRRVYKRELKVEGLLLNCTDPRTNIAKQLIPHFDKTAKEMGSKVYKSMIRRDIKLEESQLVQEDILSFAPNSHAVEDYTAAVNEFLGE